MAELHQLVINKQRQGRLVSTAGRWRCGWRQISMITDPHSLNRDEEEESYPKQI